MSAAAFTYRDLRELAGDRSGRHDVACSICGPARGRSPVNVKRKVLRVWLLPGFASFHCCRCDTSGFVHERGAAPASADVISRIHNEIAAREREEAAEQLRKARWLWARREPLESTVAERYLRDARGYSGPLPSTVGFLAARGEHAPAMITAFGFAEEPEPGRLHLRDDAVRGIHLTRLKPDGSGKASDGLAKLIIGRCKGAPIVLAPCNDLLGLHVVEGVEDGASIFDATRAGVWVAGSAGRMPALADAVPRWATVTIIGDPDDSGRRGALGLKAGLDARGLDSDVIFPAEMLRAA